MSFFGKAFRLTSSLDPDAGADLGDSLKAKKALKSLGHFRVPDYGVTPYPDQPLFSGIKSFQRANGLKVDGIMNPGGETEAKLGEKLAEAQARRQPVRPGEVRQDRPLNGARKNPIEWAGQRPAHPVEPLSPSHSFLFLKRPAPHPLKLNRTFSADNAIDLDDVPKMNQTLHKLGMLKRPKEGFSTFTTNALFDAVRAFQKRRGLRVDGVVNPDGETARAMNAGLLRLAQSAEAGDAPVDPSGESGDRTQPKGTLPDHADDGGTPDDDPDDRPDDPDVPDEDPHEKPDDPSDDEPENENENEDEDERREREERIRHLEAQLKFAKVQAAFRKELIEKNKRKTREIEENGLRSVRFEKEKVESELQQRGIINLLIDLAGGSAVFSGGGAGKSLSVYLRPPQRWRFGLRQGWRN